MLVRFFGFFIFIAASVSFAASNSEQWQSVSLAEKKIGHRHILRERVEPAESKSDPRILTQQTLELVTRVPGEKRKKSQTIIKMLETAAGAPLEIQKIVKTSLGEHETLATVDGKYLTVGIKGQKAKPKREKIPNDFLLAEGVRLALLKNASHNKALTYSTWNFGKQRFDQYRLEVTPNPLVDGERIGAWKIIRTNAGNAVGSPSTTIIADDNFYFVSEFSQSGGEPLAVVTCSRECALSKVQAFENVYRQLIKSPYRIPDSALQGKLRYTLQVPPELNIPITNEQSPEQKGEQVLLTVCRFCGEEPAPKPEVLQKFLQPTYWLDFDSPAMVETLKKAIGKGVREPEAIMTRLERYVTRYMKKGEVIYSGYSTASQALATASGDCTEQALLLAALGRAAKVPTRVAFGLVYSNERFYGKNYVFVPHAWVQAWVGDKWVSFDSAMEGFTSGHLVLAISEGQQSDFLAMSQSLERLQIGSVVQVRSKK